MPKRYKSERAAFNHVDSVRRNVGVWSCVIRKVAVDGKTYYVIGFDPVDEMS